MVTQFYELSGKMWCSTLDDRLLEVARFIDEEVTHDFFAIDEVIAETTDIISYVNGMLNMEFYQDFPEFRKGLEDRLEDANAFMDVLIDEETKGYVPVIDLNNIPKEYMAYL